jgi:hypothetical protein
MMPCHPRLNLLFFLSLTLFIVCAGCVTEPVQTVKTSTEPPAEYPRTVVYEEKEVTYPDGYYIHTVKFPHENISIIAKWFTGDAMNWEVLATCNPTINPNRIFLGNEIKIPRNIMTTQDALTLEFVEKHQARPKRKQGKGLSHAPIKPAPVETTPLPVQSAPKPAQTETTPLPVQSAPEPVEEEAPLLFGPKD